MNVIFLDFDGVIDTIHYNSDKDVEDKIKILSEICKEYNCKVVIEAAAKNAIDYDTFEIDNDWVKKVFELFNKYEIECIGRTPNVAKKGNNYYEMWKEFEIRKYLFSHPEIEHFCIIDDDDLYPNSDLRMLSSHLVKPNYYSKYKNDEGLLESHKEEVGKILKKDNKIRNLVLKYKNKKK